MTGSLILAVDTSTRASIVVLGEGKPLAISRQDVQHRHGAHLLEQIDDVFARSHRSLDDVAALAVGTGPGSFTGLRVGLATLKTIAYARRLPLVGVMSSDVLRLAATVIGAAADTAVVLPAGARDHYLARAGQDPELIAPGDLADALAGRPVLAVDTDAALLDAAAVDLGLRALEGMPAALLQLAGERIARAQTDDVAELTPAYVALPRGVRRGAEDLGWSPDLR